MTPGQHREARRELGSKYATNIREERYFKPRKPRELLRLIRLLNDAGIYATLQYTRNNVPFVEVNGRRVVWFHHSRVFRLFGEWHPPHPQPKHGHVRSSAEAAAFLVLGPKVDRG